MDQEVFKRAGLEAFFKALKESGNTLGNTLGYSFAVHTLPSTTDKLLDIFKSSYTASSNPSNTDKLLDMFKSAYTATKPSHFEHEGGSESEAEGLKDQGSEEAGGLEDQGSDSPVQSGDESVREVQNEGQEAGEEIQIQEEAVEEQVEVPLRRSTRPELVSVLRQMGQQVKWPQKMKAPYSFRNPGHWCDFHCDHGHKTEDYTALRIEVTELLKKGYLREFLSEKAKGHLNKEAPGKPTEAIPASPPRQD
ncbi:hypothetical protein F2Q69_00012578 [Brassica cretica]|uniref:Uncharacterized protein n=1 Tax=Brassica cretica TaxID=69181 RepID=A0A8S9QYK2_BRACR|nr:hypothetical protein F2Q69_00012578 [Brassica cretica]